MNSYPTIFWYILVILYRNHGVLVESCPLGTIFSMLMDLADCSTISQCEDLFTYVEGKMGKFKSVSSSRPLCIPAKLFYLTFRLHFCHAPKTYLYFL